MSNTVDNVQLNLTINGNQAINQLGKLEMEAKDLKQSIKDLKKGTDEYVDANKKLNSVSAEIQKVRNELGLAGMTMKQMQSYSRELSNQLNNTATRGTAEYTKLRTELQRVNKAIEQQRAEVKGSEGVWAKLRKEVGTFGMMAAGYLGFEAITGKIGSIIQNNAKLSDSLADIRKTTNMSAAEVKELNAQLSKMNTRTATDELRKIAIVGGQLGIAKNDILGFTNAIDKAVVALGDEFTGGAEEVTKVVGGLRNVFGDIKSDNVGEDILNIGNAINELGAKGAATGPVVADFANRIGGVASTMGLSAGQILGLSATLQELNVTAERGSTAVVKILQKMTTETATFANIAGMEVGAFEKMLNEDLFGAFQKVMIGSQSSASSATAFAAVLKDAELQGAGASEIFAKLGGNTELLGKKVELANGSLTNTNSIMNEFNIKNETLAAKLEKIQKAIGGAFTNSSVMKGLESMVGWISDLVDNSEKLSVTMEKERVNVNMLVMEMTNANTSGDRRIEIYEELNKIAPKVLEGINLESISYVKLRENLEKYNKEQINRIVIQKAQEKIDEQNIEVAKEVEKNLEAQKELQKAITELATKRGANQKEINKIANDENLTLEQKGKLILDLLGGIQAYDNAMTMAGASKNEFARGNTDLIKLGDAYSDIKSSVERVNTEQAISNTLLKERLETEKLLGIGAESQTTSAIIPPLVTTSSITGGGTPSAGGGKNIPLDKIGTEQVSKQEEYQKLLEDLANYHAQVEQMDTAHQIKKDETINGELLKIDAKYEALKQKAIDGILAIEEAEFITEEEKRIRKEEYQFELDEIERVKEEEKQAKIAEANELYFQERANFQNEILAQTMTQLELDLMAHEQHFMLLIQQYKKYGMDTTKLEQERIAISEKIKADARKKEIQTKALEFEEVFNATASFYNGVGEVVSAFVSDQEKESEDYADFMKSMKLFEIGLQSAAAIASVVAAASSTSITPIDLALKIAAGTSTVLMNIAKAKSLITARPSANTGATAKQFAEGGFSDTGTANASVYFKPTPSSQLAWVNEYGPEHITPNWMVESPKYQPVIQYLESERLKGYADGGFTATPTPVNEVVNSTLNPANNNRELIAELQLMRQVNNNLILQLQKPIEAVSYIGDDQVMDIKKKMMEIELIEEKATVGNPIIGYTDTFGPFGFSIERQVTKYSKKGNK